SPRPRCTAVRSRPQSRTAQHLPPSSTRRSPVMRAPPCWPTGSAPCTHDDHITIRHRRNSMTPLVETPSLTLLPAVDVADGQAVRLVQGEAGTETAYGSPLEAAGSFEQDGAEWIHLVDLDAAFGRGSNYDLLRKVTKSLSIKVELSGGIRDTESLERALDTGAERVNIGTAALEDPEWTAEVIAHYGDKIAIGLDVRGRTLAARGWT